MRCGLDDDDLASGMNDTDICFFDYTLDCIMFSTFLYIFTLR